MRLSAAEYPAWFVQNITPVTCPLGKNLQCEIPITRLRVILDGASCHTADTCRGHNHPDQTISDQAKAEFEWRTAH